VSAAITSSAKKPLDFFSASACGPSIGRMSMPPPALASSAMAPAGAPPVKKKASSEPSFILSPAWLGLMYSGLMSDSFKP
jgi:hypothetical protein